MKSFKLNADGQFELDGQNNLVMVTEDEEIMQCVQMAVMTNLGEWFLNPTIGWDRYNTLGQKPNAETTTSDIISAILTSESRIASVTNVSVEFDGRKAKIKYTVTKQNGEELSGEATV